MKWYSFVIIEACLIILIGIYMAFYWVHPETISKIVFNNATFSFEVVHEQVIKQGHFGGYGIIGMGCLLLAFGLIMRASLLLN